jgi:PRTRC genetic system protein B
MTLSSLLSQRLDIDRSLAELYFLDSGHFLFRRQKADRTSVTKFITVDDLVAAFTGMETDTGWMSPGVLRAGYCAHGPWFVFAAPPQKTTLILTTGSGLETIIVPLPPLVFAGVGNQFYIVATKSAAFDPKEKVCRAPLPNVDASSHCICYGGNTPPEANPGNAAAAWQMFIASPFNNHLANSKARSMKYNHDIRVLLRCLAARKRAKGFPLNELVEDGKTVEQFIRAITGIGGEHD